MPTRKTHSDVQGEGNYDAARAYNARTRKFIESGRVDAAARAAAPHDAGERETMRQAETEGRSHAQGQPETLKDDGQPRAPIQPEGRPKIPKEAPSTRPGNPPPPAEKFPGR